ncbi:hypothetical protein [Demequina subtropica]|uniref:hypothetical protein n=1 Tax=Demequina subtropica TaxID=1638989 RepID=UPI000785EB93|nr:hypothetical protein [Demequina subtropica]
MTLFIVSGIVVVLGSLLNASLVSRFAKEYERRVTGTGTGSEPPAIPYGVSRAVLASWFERLTDVAANLPAMVLTAVAFADLSLLESDLAHALLIVAIVSITIFATTRAAPSRPPMWTAVSLSGWSWGLLAANILGVLAAATS